MDQRKQHTFDTDPHTFWQMYMLDEAFLRAVYAHMKLGIDHFEIITQSGEGDSQIVERMIHILPEREMPGFLSKLVKGTSLVKQHERYDAAKGEMKITIEVPVIGGRVEYGGRYTWEKLGDDKMRRDWVGHCNVRIPLVGRKVEAFFLDEIGQGIEDMAPFIRQWLRDHAEA